MKKTILGLMPLLVASMLIAGCGKKAESSAPASSSEAPSSSSEAPQSYKAEDVIWEIDQNLFAKDASKEDDISSVEQEGITFYQIVWAVNFSSTQYSQDTDATEAFLNAAFDDPILGEVLPSYLSLAGSPTFAANSQRVSETDYVNASQAFYATPLKDVAVSVTTYIYAAPGSTGPLVYSFYAFDVPAKS